MSAATMETPIPTARKRKGVNLRVLGHGPGFYFGSNPHGKVLPIWVAELSGRSAEQLVAEGDFEWTDEEAVGTWRAPSPKNADDAGPIAAMNEELDRLRRTGFESTGIAKQLEGENLELKRNKELMVRQLGEQSEQIAHWRELSEGYRVQVETMTSAYEERDRVVTALTEKNKELEERLAAILKVPAPSDKPKSEKKLEKAPVG